MVNGNLLVKNPASGDFRILMSGSRAPTTLASEYAASLEVLESKVTKHYGADERPSRLGGFARKVALRLVPQMVWKQSNHDLLDIARSSRPHVTWLFKGMDIFPSTIRSLRKEGWRPVAYNADHPYDFTSRGCGNSNVANAIAEYEMYMTFSHYIKNQLVEKFPRLNVCVLPFGHSVSDGVYKEISNIDETNSLCFIGTPDQHRIDKLKILINAGLNIDIYGSGWENAASQLAGATFYPSVFGVDMYKTLRKYRVQLNFLRPHNIHSHNMRSFEAPACGAIMLAEDTVEHREFFKADHEAFYFANDEEMIGQARFLLALSPEEAHAIRARARARSINEPYSYHHRAAQALTHLKELVGHD